MVTEPMVSAPTKPELVNAVEPEPPVKVAPNDLVALLAVTVSALAVTELPLAVVAMLTVVAPVLVSATFWEL